MFDVMLLQGQDAQYRNMIDNVNGLSRQRGVAAPGSADTSSNSSNSSNSFHSKHSPSSAPIPEDTARSQYSRDGDSLELSQSEQEEVKQLKERDQEVRQHEQAHASAAGPHGRGISYEFTTGPDSKRYATGGHVDIDMSPVQGDPQATIQKAQTLQRAASSPEEPSSQDKSVEAEARDMELQARKELQEEQESERASSAEQQSEAPSDSRASRANPYAAAQQQQGQFQAMMSSSLNLVA